MGVVPLSPAVCPPWSRQRWPSHRAASMRRPDRGPWQSAADRLCLRGLLVPYPQVRSTGRACTKPTWCRRLRWTNPVSRLADRQGSPPVL